MIKATIRKLAKQMGYQIIGPTYSYGMERSLQKVIERQRINLILDVGANAGQFAQSVREAGYRGRIVSFEPQSEAHRKLNEAAARDPLWTVAERMAIGDREGTVTINISQNSYSSSLLPMQAVHQQIAPDSVYVAAEEVPIRRLDDLDILRSDDRVLLKIDVQGYEKPVLDGARRLVDRCHAVQVEMSIEPLYEGQLLAKGLWDLLAERGFELWYLDPVFRHQDTGRLMWMDGLFVRRTQ